MSASPEIARANGRKGGRPLGKKSKSTLEKEIVLKDLRQRILKNMGSLFNAAKISAVGATFVYKIEQEIFNGKKQKSKPKLVTEQWELEQVIDELEPGETSIVLGEGEDEQAYYFLSTKEPNIKAFSELTDRAFGRPTESSEVTVKMPKPLLHALRNNNGNGETPQPKQVTKPN